MSVLMLLTGGDAAPAPSGPTTVRQFTDRTHVASEPRPVSVATTITSRSTHKVRAAATDLTLTYGNYLSGAITVGAAVEIGGTVYQLTSGGQAKITLAQGQFAMFGPFTASLAAGDTLPVRTFYSVPAGAALPVVQGTNGTASLGEGEMLGQDLTLPGSGAITANGGYGSGPLTIKGTIPASTVAVAVLGDSITERGNDTATVYKAFIARAMNATSRPYTNYAVWGQALAHMVVNGAPSLSWNIQIGTTIDAHTHVISAYGRNDMGSAVAGVKTNFKDVWTLAAANGRKVWQTTITPSSSSTDGWATVASQTANADNVTRVDVNNWIRDGAPLINGTPTATGATDPAAIRAGATGHPLAGFIEVADTVESARNSGLWKAGTLTDDGVHPSTAGHEAMMVPVQTWAAGLTA